MELNTKGDDDDRDNVDGIASQPLGPTTSSARMRPLPSSDRLPNDFQLLRSPTTAIEKFVPNLSPSLRIWEGQILELGEAVDLRQCSDAPIRGWSFRVDDFEVDDFEVDELREVLEYQRGDCCGVASEEEGGDGVEDGPVG